MTLPLPFDPARHVAGAEHRRMVLDYLAVRSIPEPNSGCALWFGAINKKGYGVLSYNLSGRKFSKAHRLALFLQVGSAIDGNMACHKCDTPSCVNPEHLYVGTAQSNSDDMIARGRAKRLSGSSNPAWQGGKWINRAKPGQVRGEACSYAKLNEECVRDIRKSSETRKALAEKYGVGQRTIRDIINKKIWAHVEDCAGLAAHSAAQRAIANLDAAIGA